MVGKLRVANVANDVPILTAFYPSQGVEPRRHTRAVNWPDVRMLFHVETGGEEHDPFHDLSNASSSSRERRESLIGHLISDVHWVFLLQHRTFLYTLYINGDYLRVLRWNRAGIMVTRPVFYLDDPSVLPRLVWRLTHLTDEQQGLDTSVTRLQVGSEEYKLMNELARPNPILDIPCNEGLELPPFASSDPIPASTASSSAARDASHRLPPDDDPRVFQYIREDFRRSLESVWPRYCIKVGEEGREFLVAKPVGSSEELFGRGCNCYIAVDRATRRLVWLKDSWRPVDERSTPEGAVLKTFVGDPKMSAPTLICHGYVGWSGATSRGETSTGLDAGVNPSSARKETSSESPNAEKIATADDGRVIGVKRAREEDSEPEAKKRTRRATSQLPAYAQYRLAVKEVGFDLERFTSSWQLVRLIFECIKTHSRAWKEYGILHGDISEGNILICPTITRRKDGKGIVVWHGMLIDWELARFVDKDGKPIRAHTHKKPLLSWQFASLDAVRNPDKILGVEDELEAFFNVLLVHSVRFLRSTLPQRSVAPFVTEFWDTFKMYPDGSLECSDLKQKALKRGRLECNGVGDVLFCDDGYATVHPLNGLLLELMRRFQARYALLQWEADKRTESQFQPSPALPCPGPRVVLGELEAQHNILASGHQALPPVIPPLSPKTIELARSLQTHTAVIKLFSKWMINQEWPLHDKVGDRLPDDYVSTRRLVEVPAPVNAHQKREMARKRQKLEEGDIAGALRRQSK
ncbi:hypothetical protein GY45DRAFT_1244915 [Cubamyces sp. BRFM 1775]|nr:hypothetical protein GY45DRAFT_1244915 [Cubamyces sp. BRFM 1775]